MAVVEAESFACTTISTFGQVIACKCAGEVWIQVATKHSNYVEANDHVLPKEKLKCLTEMLHGFLQLSGVDSIVTQNSSHQEGQATIPV